jgi:hypothetical protein
LKKLRYSFGFLVCVAAFAAAAFGQATRAITIVNEPDARVLINGVL